jgi:hypothetical protein
VRELVRENRPPACIGPVTRARGEKHSWRPETPRDRDDRAVAAAAAADASGEASSRRNPAM